MRLNWGSRRWYTKVALVVVGVAAAWTTLAVAIAIVVSLADVGDSGNAQPPPRATTPEPTKRTTEGRRVPGMALRSATELACRKERARIARTYVILTKRPSPPKILRADQCSMQGRGYNAAGDIVPIYWFVDVKRVAACRFRVRFEETITGETHGESGLQRVTSSSHDETCQSLGAA